MEDAFNIDQNQVLPCLEKLVAKHNIDIIVIVDTRGSATPHEVNKMFNLFKHKFPTCKLGIHTHNDLGLATANTLEAINCGAYIIEGCFLGIGERAGNVALENVYLILKYKYNEHYSIPKLKNQLEKLCKIYNLNIPCNQILIGNGYRKHISGIHQDAEEKRKGIYSFMDEIEYDSPVNPLSSKKTIIKNSKYFSDEFITFYREVNKIIELDLKSTEKIFEVIKNEKTEF